MAACARAYASDWHFNANQSAHVNRNDRVIREAANEQRQSARTGELDVLDGNGGPPLVSGSDKSWAHRLSRSAAGNAIICLEAQERRPRMAIGVMKENIEVPCLN